MVTPENSNANIGSFENAENSEYARRQEIGFICANGHEFIVPFAAEAEAPKLWECAKCGTEAVREDGEIAVVKEEKPLRTHWDMLCERRSVPELEEILVERLTEIRRLK